MDLCLAYNMEEGTMESIQIEYLNLINLMYASRNMEKFLDENAHAPDGSHRTQPILTRETMTYTLSFHLESYTPVQDRAKSYVPVRTGTYQYIPVHTSTGFLKKYVLVRTGTYN
jgi:hypothetical protein